MSAQWGYFFVALPCEAKPLIRHFKLKKDLSITAFSLYRNEQLCLTVTGLGKSAMAAGVAYTFAYFPSTMSPVVLNIGIAGHRSHALGAVFAAEKIIDMESERAYYPQIVAQPPCATAIIKTVAQVQTTYKGSSLYEMEASAFYEIATRFSSSELIQCLKIISDNEQYSAEQVNAAQVSEWVSHALPFIEQYSQALKALSASQQAILTPYYAEILDAFHFSRHEKIQLKRLLNKRALMLPKQALTNIFATHHSAKSILLSLRTELDNQAFGGF